MVMEKCSRRRSNTALEHGAQQACSSSLGFAPAALGTVCDDSDDRIDEDIDETGHQHQHGSIVECQSENISEEEWKGNRHDLPRDAACCRITERIAYFL